MLLDQLLGDAFGGNLCADDCLHELSDRFQTYNIFPLQQL
jgi:hypothetical protein